MVFQMINFSQGNLLDSSAEALVNTVNTVGVMGKGIALMFKERFPKNMLEYSKACKSKEVQTGKMFITTTDELIGPKWIVNFPTKQHWKNPSQMAWIESGLKDLRIFLTEQNVKSIAIPPLGSGNGGLNWQDVRELIQLHLSDLNNVEIIVYEPTAKYQNITKKTGTKILTPARAIIAELIRQYWILGIECSLLEVQKLAWFLDRVVNKQGLHNDFRFEFRAHLYGPYSPNLQQLLKNMDGSYLNSNKHIADAQPDDVIYFNDSQKDHVANFLKEEVKEYLPALEQAIDLIEGFESPYGMELLSTVDWLLFKGACEPNLESVKAGLANWPADSPWATERKLKLFDDKSLNLAISHLASFNATV